MCSLVIVTTDGETFLDISAKALLRDLAAKLSGRDGNVAGHARILLGGYGIEVEGIVRLI